MDEQRQHPALAVLLVLAAVGAVVSVLWVRKGAVLVLVVPVLGALWCAWRAGTGRWRLRGSPPAREALSWFWHSPRSHPVLAILVGVLALAGALFVALFVIAGLVFGGYPSTAADWLGVAGLLAGGVAILVVGWWGARRLDRGFWGRDPDPRR